ncbi:hypothetical protein ACP70R_006725 [Stipagrostis hirtigluma subsp. patula]
MVKEAGTEGSKKAGWRAVEMAAAGVRSSAGAKRRHHDGGDSKESLALLAGGEGLYGDDETLDLEQGMGKGTLPEKEEREEPLPEKEERQAPLPEEKEEREEPLPEKKEALKEPLPEKKEALKEPRPEEKQTLPEENEALKEKLSGRKGEQLPEGNGVLKEPLPVGNGALKEPLPEGNGALQEPLQGDGRGSSSGQQEIFPFENDGSGTEASHAIPPGAVVTQTPTELAIQSGAAFNPNPAEHAISGTTTVQTDGEGLESMVQKLLNSTLHQRELNVQDAAALKAFVQQMVKDAVSEHQDVTITPKDRMRHVKDVLCKHQTLSRLLYVFALTAPFTLLLARPVSCDGKSPTKQMIVSMGVEMGCSFFFLFIAHCYLLLAHFVHTKAPRLSKRMATVISSMLALLATSWFIIYTLRVPWELFISKFWIISGFAIAATWGATIALGWMGLIQEDTMMDDD